MESDLVPYAAVTAIPARSVLVLAPHPDDEVFGCGGAIRSHVLQGVPVCTVIMTDGAKYGSSALRSSESRVAAHVLGYGEPDFWGLPDRALLYSQALLTRIIDKIKAIDADLVYAPSPWEVHPDHRQLSMLAAQAVLQAGGGRRLAYYEVGAALKPNLLLDLTPVLNCKKQAMLCFASQLEKQDYSRHILALNQYRTYTLSPHISAAEAFLLLGGVELSSPTLQAFWHQIALGASPADLTMQPNLPLVSIIVRSSGQAALARALDTIATQTYPAIEILLTASHPDHAAFPTLCGHFPVELLATDMPLSRHEMAFKGLAQARGTLVLHLDESGWLMPGHIARLVDVFLKDPAVLAAYTGYSIANKEGAPTGQVVDAPWNPDVCKVKAPIPLHAIMFRKSLLNPGTKNDTALVADGSPSFWSELCLRAFCVHVPGATAVWHQSEDGVDCAF